MKQILLCLCIVATFIQCSKEETAAVDNEAQDLIYQQSLDLSTQLPNTALDNANKGLYVGTVATTDLSFHEKIFINFENDGEINAQIITPTDKYLFNGKLVSEKSNSYLFIGSLGQFLVTLNDKSAVITNAVFLDKTAVIHTVKDRSTTRMSVSLGTFQSGDSSITGTWDTMWVYVDEENWLPSQISMVRDGGTTFTLPQPSGSWSHYCWQTTPIEYAVGVILDLTGSPLLLGEAITYNLSGEGGMADNTCFSNPNLIISENAWQWNGKSGIITIDQASMPSFY